MTLYLRKSSPFWWCEAQRNHKRIRISTRTKDKREAERFHRVWIADMDRTGDQDHPVFTLAQAADKYFEIRREPGGRKRSIASDRQTLKEVIAILGDLDVNSIKNENVTSWVSAMLARGLAASTCNRRIAVLKAVLRFARDELGAITGSLPWMRPLREVPNDRRAFTDEEVIRVLAAAPEYLRRYLVFLLDTGARALEASEITWEDIDLASTPPAVTFRATRTKAGKSRVVPVTRRLEELLRAMKAEASLRAAAGCDDLVGPHGRVFTWVRSGDGKVMEFSTPRTSWERCRDDAGVPWAVLHTCRHSFATRLIRANVPLPVVQKLGGWATLNQVERYVTVVSTQLAEAVAALDEF